MIRINSDSKGEKTNQLDKDHETLIFESDLKERQRKVKMFLFSVFIFILYINVNKLNSAYQRVCQIMTN